VAQRPDRALRQQTFGGACPLQHREPRSARPQPVTAQQAPDRRRRQHHPLTRELIAVPLRTAGRPSQGHRHHPAFRLDRDRRRAAPRGPVSFGMHAVAPVLLKPLSQAIKQRLRQTTPTARLTDIPEMLRSAQDTQALRVYAVFEGHWSAPLHVSPPRETRGRIGQLALLSSPRADDHGCQHLSETAQASRNEARRSGRVSSRGVRAARPRACPRRPAPALRRPA
jgi:hypothetical protein